MNALTIPNRKKIIWISKYKKTENYNEDFGPDDHREAMMLHAKKTLYFFGALTENIYADVPCRYAEKWCNFAKTYSIGDSGLFFDYLQIIQIEGETFRHEDHNQDAMPRFMSALHVMSKKTERPNDPPEELQAIFPKVKWPNPFQNTEFTSEIPQGWEDSFIGESAVMWIVIIKEYFNLILSIHKPIEEPTQNDGILNGFPWSSPLIEKDYLKINTDINSSERWPFIWIGESKPELMYIFNNFLRGYFKTFPKFTKYLCEIVNDELIQFDHQKVKNTFPPAPKIIDWFQDYYDVSDDEIEE